MQYMLLIHDDEGTWGAMSEEERQGLMGEYAAFSERLRSDGAMVDGNRLDHSHTATTVRVRDGERILTDGPFAETREVLGGYYLVEADTLDQAIEYAAQIPSARLGAIEVRPVMQVPSRTG